MSRYPFYFSLSPSISLLFFHFITPKFFLVISSTSYVYHPFQTLHVHVQLHNQLFTSFILKISRFSPFFSTLFHCCSSKFTTITAQFQFYNCKLHFTSAEIGIGCTLKYALASTVPWKVPGSTVTLFALLEVSAAYDSVDHDLDHE